MKKYQYSWSKPFAVPAQVVGEFFYSLPERSPDAFIVASEPEDAPTHTLFEWDDTVAAQEFRRVQARVMLASLQVEIVDVKKKAETVRAFIGASTRGEYVATLEASVEELTEEEAKCLVQMRLFKQRWKGLRMAHEVVQAIAHVEAGVGKKKKAA